MAEVPVPRPESDKESHRIPKTNGETRPKEQKGQGQAQGQEEAQRRRDLERERREASQKKQAEDIEKAIKTARKAVEAQRQPPPENPQKAGGPPEGTRFIKSDKPLIALSREAVVAAVREAGLSIEVPQDWDTKVDLLKRLEWVRAHKLVPIVKLPESKASEGIYVEESEGKVYISGIRDQTDINPENVQKKIDDAGIDRKLKPPEGFEDKTFDEKLRWYRENGIVILPAISGAQDEEVGGEGRGVDEKEVEGARRRFSIVEAIDMLKASIAAGETVGQRQETHLEILNYDFRADTTAYIIRRLLELRTTEADPNLTAEQRVDVQGKIRALDEHVRFLIEVANGNDGQEHFSFVNRFAKTIEGFENRAKQSGRAEEDLLERVVSLANRNAIKARRDRLEQDFEAMYNGMSLVARGDLLGKFDDEAASYRKALGNYIPSLREIELRLADAIQRTVNKEFPIQKGISEWYTTKAIENMEAQLMEEHELGVPNDWRNSMRNVLNNLRYAESHDFSIDQIREVLGRIGRIAEAIPVSTVTGKDHPETLRLRERARNLQDEVTQLRDSVQAVLQLREAVTSTAMDPEKVEQVFLSPLWRDTTWKLYFSRFFKDHEQKDFVDGKGEKYNLMDKAMQVYFKRFREEKRRMNFMEQLTRSDLKLQFIEPEFAATAQEGEDFYWDQKWLILKVLSLQNSKKFEEKFDGKSFDDIIKITDTSLDAQQVKDEVRKRINEAFAKLRDADLNWLNDKEEKINDVWGHTAGIYLRFYPQMAIEAWYRNNLLLGAHGTDSEGRRFLDLRRQELLGDLRTKLGSADMGVGEDTIKIYEDAQLLNQVINNAYHVTWMWGAFSEYGGIRVFNRDKVWYRDRDGNPVYQVGEFVYSRDSRLYNGRVDDWFNEFLINERRGKAGGGRIGKKDDVDYVFTRNMIGKRKGILHQNRLLTKLVNDNLRLYVDNLIDGVKATGDGGFGDHLKDYAKEMENIDYLRVNWDKIGTEEQGDTYDFGWARGATIVEMFEDGLITLENIDWTKTFEDDRTNMSQFNMQDWWGDRSATHKFFGSGALQKYLQVPGTEEFYKLNTIENFYSKREIRIKPWFKLIIPAHFEIGKHWQEWFKLPYDMSLQEKEVVINEAVNANRIEAADHGWMKDKHLGVSLGRVPLPVVSPVTRWFRKYFELADVAARETGKRAPALFLLFLWEFFKAFFTQGQAQLSGK